MKMFFFFQETSKDLQKTNKYTIHIFKRLKNNLEALLFGGNTKRNKLYFRIFAHNCLYANTEGGSDDWPDLQDTTEVCMSTSLRHLSSMLVATRLNQAHQHTKQTLHSNKRSDTRSEKDVSSLWDVLQKSLRETLRRNPNLICLHTYYLPVFNWSNEIANLFCKKGNLTCTF